jgi:SAM-dependent methyltransferase
VIVRAKAVIPLDRLYDAVNTAIFLPSGGSRRVRQTFVDTLDVRRGQRVLELGCGTGQVTALLVAKGADVVAVDALPAMLAGARRRAPRATIVEGDAFAVDVGDAYDRVVLSFVLHNFGRDDRVRLLHRAATHLAEDGRIGVLEWALPRQAVAAALWRRFLGVLEPSPAVPEILDGALDNELLVAGLRLDIRRSVAGGRAQILGLSPEGARRAGRPAPRASSAPGGSSSR